MDEAMAATVLAGWIAAVVAEVVQDGVGGIVQADVVEVWAAG